MSDEQVQDALYLRRLYLTRRGQLAAEREAMTLQLHRLDAHQPPPEDKLNRLSDLSARLKNNAAADYTAYLKVACATRRGVGFLLSPRHILSSSRLSSP